MRENSEKDHSVIDDVKKLIKTTKRNKEKK